MPTFEPAYIALYKSGELARRAERLEARLSSCQICPRMCRVNRLNGVRGFCHSGYRPIVSAFCAHHGEEPALSGTGGSGTIFFGNCTMWCVYCQNYQISQSRMGEQTSEIDIHTLAERMLYLQELGCHNINLVSPTHFVPQIVRALVEAAGGGLRIPLVYNTSGYDSADIMRELDGIVDIYLPDIRYASDDAAKRFSYTSNYVTNARASVKEMYRQVGDLVVDDSGIAQRGLIVRHLILPNRLAGSEESLSWLASELSPAVTVSIMSQYYPAYRASRIEGLSRTITPSEYDEVIEVMGRLGLENGWIQQLGSAENYRPNFARDGYPFDSAQDRPFDSTQADISGFDSSVAK